MKNRFALVALAAVMLLALPLTACSAGNAAVYASEGHLADTKKVESLNGSLQDGTLNFAISLFNRTREDGEGFFLSPASIFLALAMTRNGANADTAAEMDAMFGASGVSLDKLNAYARDMQYLITGRTPSAFELANSLWIRDSFSGKVQADFLQRNADFFGASVQTLDFSSSAAAKTINDWVAKNTKNRIKSVIDSGIDPSSVMFLINTIYFKSDWRTPFDAADTLDATFHATAGDVTVKMMKKIDSFGYYENEDLQAVRLPYSDGRTSMLVLLPKVGHEAATETLDPTVWKTVLDGVNAGNLEMVLRLPRTQFEFKAELKSTLSDLGMPTAFTDFADFTGISADGGLMIGSVIHKTFLAIDEKGTEAAAATSVDIRVTSMPYEPDLKVTVDRPFVVAIVDDLSGLPIFIGNIATP